MNVSFSYDPISSEFLMLLRQRNLPTALEYALSRIMETHQTKGAALCFRETAAEPYYFSVGEISLLAQTQIRQWEEALLFLPLPTDVFSAPFAPLVVLPHGEQLQQILLCNHHRVVGQLVLIWNANQLIDEQLQRQLYVWSHMLGNVASLLHELDLTRQRLSRLNLLYDIGQKLASNLDLPQVLRDTMSLTAKAMNAHASTLMLIDPEDPNYLVFEIAHGSKESQLQHYRLPKTQGIAGWVASHGRPIIVNDPANDERHLRRVDLRTGFSTKNIICVPVQIKGEIIGVLQVLNKVGQEGFDDADLELLLTLASQASIAIENARLYHNLRQEQDRIIAAQEEVRRELSRNLHDSTLQRLAAMGMSIEHLKILYQRKPNAIPEELAALTELNSRAMREARTLLFELRPVVLETQGLGAGLQAYIQRLNKTTTLHSPVTLELPLHLPRMDSNIERTLFAIIQEAVGNARKHAQAKTITVRLELQEQEMLHVAIEDDGVGFEIQKMRERYENSGSLGMINMRERANRINAKWSLESHLGIGTCIHVIVPLQRPTVVRL